MAHLLVLNHGTGNDTMSPANLITRLEMNTHATQNVLCYPGFGSSEFNRRGKDLENWKFPKKSFVQASGYIEPTATWLGIDLLQLMGQLQQTDINYFDEITFIGFSRGCMLTWHQIAFLRANGWTGTARVLSYDPCYGPYSGNQYRGADAQTIRNSQDYATLVYEVVMLWEFQRKLVLPVLLHPNPDRRYFLPGHHGTAVNNDDLHWGRIHRLGEAVCRKFLSAFQIPNIPAFLGHMDRAEERSIYTEVKLRDYWGARTSMIATDRIRFDYARRPRVKEVYDAKKEQNLFNWADSGFFYNPQDFHSFRRDYPRIADEAFKRTSTVPGHAFVADFVNLKARENRLAWILWVWGTAQQTGYKNIWICRQFREALMTFDKGDFRVRA